MSCPRFSRLTNFQTQCKIFRTTFNPLRLRLGNKILRQRLRGPSMLAYYPRRVGMLKDLKREYQMYDIEDEDEEARVDKLRQLKDRGKGVPAKKKSKAESKKFTRKKMG